MNNSEALAYIDRLWLKYGGLYANEKTAGNSEEAALMQKYFEALGVAKDAIKALEQESIVDKIRTEIERQEKWLMVAGYNQYNVDISLDTIKSVVDKYKAESEG